MTALELLRRRASESELLAEGRDRLDQSPQWSLTLETRFEAHAEKAPSGLEPL